MAASTRRGRSAARLLRDYASINLDSFEGTAWVVAAHPGEEALACGGLLASLRALGRDVRVVFLTSGERSHAKHVAPAVLGPQREAEALAAARLLGVPAGNVHFLRAPDGNARRDRPRVEAALRALFATEPPSALFVPGVNEGDSDLATANQTAQAALSEAPVGTRVFEYPYWAWRVWPFVRLQPPLPWLGREEVRDRLGVISASVRHHLGREFARRFPLEVDVRQVLGMKAAAVAAHRSQVEHRNGDRAWWTLEDVNHGDFLRQFFRDGERYREVAGRRR
jgi:LmbE family N-acetylglucosaminyl deacetylase